jgi:hypothetical protein
MSVYTGHHGITILTTCGIMYRLIVAAIVKRTQSRN